MELCQISHQLSSSPKRFSDCCLAISNTLIAQLAAILPKKPKFTLSVGSGSGFLEGLLAYSEASCSVQGVEVDSSINRYIAEEDMHVVGGGWGLHADAQHATAWMFVYPRDPKLVAKYIDAYGDQAVEMIVWLGPRVDWEDYEPCFRASPFSALSFLDNVGLAPYETMVVARNRRD
ncbi:uncharacterized protein N7459_003824 [Penicillium hispanicum]|uniref:uncharacterized protein n=1 Tax=Penicillium hispanicum TaxID=1080232 RepID=UPI00254002BF|nr:uncharacterized protein N7459_003824 [Penicillium hispanicum]KAJ5584024.1 hypothetical protein N7459_003824 [Penicillium hispanicum]